MVTKKVMATKICKLKREEARYTLKVSSFLKSFYVEILNKITKEDLMEELCVAQIERDNAKNEYEYCLEVSKSKSRGIKKSK